MFYLLVLMRFLQIIKKQTLVVQTDSSGDEKVPTQNRSMVEYWSGVGTQKWLLIAFRQISWLLFVDFLGNWPPSVRPTRYDVLGAFLDIGQLIRPVGGSFEWVFECLTHVHSQGLCLYRNDCVSSTSRKFVRGQITAI